MFLHLHLIQFYFLVNYWRTANTDTKGRRLDCPLLEMPIAFTFVVLIILVWMLLWSCHMHVLDTSFANGIKYCAILTSNLRMERRSILKNS